MCRRSQSAKCSCRSALDAFGSAVVRRVANEQVTEPEPVVSRKLRSVRSDELLANERRQPGRDPEFLGCESLDSAAMEDLALDRASLQHDPLLGLELVESSREQRLDRRRDDDIRIGGRAEHRDHLLDKQWVSAGGVEDSTAKVLVDLLAAEPLLDQQLALLLL